MQRQVQDITEKVTKLEHGRITDTSAEVKTVTSVGQLEDMVGTRGAATVDQMHQVAMGAQREFETHRHALCRTDPGDRCCQTGSWKKTDTEEALSRRRTHFQRRSTSEVMHGWRGTLM